MNNCWKCCHQRLAGPWSCTFLRNNGSVFLHSLEWLNRTELTVCTFKWLMDYFFPWNPTLKCLVTCLDPKALAIQRMTDPKSGDHLKAYAAGQTIAFTSQILDEWGQTQACQGSIGCRDEACLTTLPCLVMGHLSVVYPLIVRTCNFLYFILLNMEHSFEWHENHSGW